MHSVFHVLDIINNLFSLSVFLSFHLFLFFLPISHPLTYSHIKYAKCIFDIINDANCLLFSLFLYLSIFTSFYYF